MTLPRRRKLVVPTDYEREIMDLVEQIVPDHPDPRVRTAVKVAISGRAVMLWEQQYGRPRRRPAPSSEIKAPPTSIGLTERQ